MSEQPPGRGWPGDLNRDTWQHFGQPSYSTGPSGQSPEAARAAQPPWDPVPRSHPADQPGSSYGPAQAGYGAPWPGDAYAANQGGLPSYGPGQAAGGAGQPAGGAGQPAGGAGPAAPGTAPGPGQRAAGPGPSGTAAWSMPARGAGAARESGQRSQPPLAESKGFLNALFDFSFTSFVTPKVVKGLYLLLVLVVGLSALVFSVAVMTTSFVLGLIILVIGAPLYFLVVTALYRVTLEFFMVIFRMAEDIRALRERGGVG